MHDAITRAQWLAALVPPEATDELAYHLPEARTLADTHVLHFMLGDDRIYGGSGAGEGRASPARS